MDAALVTAAARRFWSDIHQAWAQMVAADWPKWCREFTVEPTVQEFEAAFRKSYDAGSKTPPPWETVKRHIFASRRKRDDERRGETRQCGLCACGLRSVLVHSTPDGRQVPMDPERPQPVPDRRIYRVAVPCSCPLGDEANMGSRQALSEVQDGQAKVPGYSPQIRQRLCRLAIGARDEETAYRGKCQQRFEAEGGWPAYTNAYGRGRVSDDDAAVAAGEDWMATARG